MAEGQWEDGNVGGGWGRDAGDGGGIVLLTPLREFHLSSALSPPSISLAM